MTEFINVNWLIDEDMMETKYKLLVKGSGKYSAESLTELIWIVFNIAVNISAMEKVGVIEVHHSDGLVIQTLCHVLWGEYYF